MTKSCMMRRRAPSRLSAVMILGALSFKLGCSSDSPTTAGTPPSGGANGEVPGAPVAGSGVTAGTSGSPDGSAMGGTAGTGGTGTAGTAGSDATGGTNTGGGVGLAGTGGSGVAGSAGVGAGGAPADNCEPAAPISVKPAIQPQATLHPFVDQFFNSGDAFVQGTIIPNIEQHRKSDATIKVVTETGAPAAGAQVSALLVNSDFKWGACPPRPVTGAESNISPDVEALWGELFNYAIPQYTTKWANIEDVRGTYDFAAVDSLLGIMDRQGIEMEQHFLAGYHPLWITTEEEGTLLSPQEAAPLQEAFALEFLERYSDRVEYFQVYNEDFKTHIERANIFVDETAFFQRLTQMYPNLKFGVNDHWEFVEGENGGLPSPVEVKARFPGIHFLGIHAHSPRRLWASPQQIYATFNPYTGSGVYLHITEFGIIKDQEGDTSIQGNVRTGTWTDDLLAQYFVQTFATSFSHPAVGAFNHFGVGPHINRYNGNNLFVEGGGLTPAYHALRSLLIDKFRTLSSGATDPAGEHSFRGFHGEYEVTVTPAGGSPVTGRFYLEPGDAQTFILRATAAGLQRCQE